jgi:hypothetical protein
MCAVQAAKLLYFDKGFNFGDVSPMIDPLRVFKTLGKPRQRSCQTKKMIDEVDDATSQK